MLSSEALSAATPAHDANKVVEDAGSHGTVMLSSEALSAAAPVHDATKVVEEAGSDESQTVMLSSEALSAAAPVHDATKVVEEAGSDESQTVMLSSEALSAAAPAHDANKVVEDAGSDESQTVMLSSEALSAAAPAHDANKVVEDAGSDESQTVMLSSEALSAAAPVHDANKVVEEAGSDESGTVMLSSEALSAAASGARKNDANEAVEDAEDAGTMILQTTDTLRPVEQEDAPEDPPTLSQPESDSTVMLESAMPLTDAKTGAVIFRGKVDPSLQAATRIVSPDSLRESFDEARADYGSGSVENVSNEPSSASETRVGRGSPGSFRFVALVAAIAILAVAVLALPLMRILGSALTTESSHRARALVYLLAATNVAALSQSPPGARSLEHVIDEPGVVAAYILDPSGNLLAPEGGDLSSLPADALEDAAGLPALLTRDLRNGDVLIMTPITGDGRRMGVAVLQFRPQTVTSWSTIMLVIGALLLLVGVGVAVLLARRWTLGPLRDLRDDVLALREGLPGTLPEERPYSELSDLARSFNELLD